MLDHNRTEESGIAEIDTAIDEFRRKITDIIQRDDNKVSIFTWKESSDIIDAALLKAEGIISEVTSKAEQIIAEAKLMANEEAAGIIEKAEKRAKHIILEADSKAIAEASEKVESKVERLFQRAKERSEGIIDNAKQMAKDESERIRVAAEKEAEQIISNAREKASAKVDHDLVFPGVVEIKVIPPTNRRQLMNLKASLAEVDGIKSVGEFMSYYNKNRLVSCGLYVGVKQAIPLVNILKNIPAIKSAINEAGYIKVSLNE
jgi:vacuolar-type H+-ATPase subunit H